MVIDVNITHNLSWYLLHSVYWIEAARKEGEGKTEKVESIRLSYVESVYIRMYTHGHEATLTAFAQFMDKYESMK